MASGTCGHAWPPGRPPELLQVQWACLRLACQALLAALASSSPSASSLPPHAGVPLRLAALVPGRSLLETIGTALRLELAWAGQPLWLFRP